MFEADITCKIDVGEILCKADFDEIYHLAALHHSSSVNDAYDMTKNMIDVNFNSTRYILDEIISLGNHMKIFYAGSSQMYSPVIQSGLINLDLPFIPSTFYGFTKLWSQQLISYYRDHYQVFGVTGILFNHESPRRPGSFVTRYITKTAAKIKLGKKENMKIRNINALVDWSSSKDFVVAMNESLNVNVARDYVFGSGKCETIRSFIDNVFSHHNLDWEKYVITENVISNEVGIAGDPAALIQHLNWKPNYTFADICIEMANADLDFELDNE